MTCLYPSPLFSFHSSRSHPFLYLSLPSYLLSPLLSSLSFSSLSPLLSSLHCSFPSFHSYLPYVPLSFSLTSLLSSFSSIPPLLSSLPFIIPSLSTLDNISKETDNTLWHWHFIRPRKSPLQVRGMTIWIFISIVRYLFFKWHPIKRIFPIPLSTWEYSNNFAGFVFLTFLRKLVFFFSLTRF